MARCPEWVVEVAEARRREPWSLYGPNRLVKVVPLAEKRTLATGYITVAKSLFRKTPREIENQLGLQENSQQRGSRIYRLLRLPLAHEYQYELTTHYPDGLAFNPAMSDPRYPPGSKSVHQWRLLETHPIPVHPTDVIDLLPGQIFQYSD